MVSDTRLYGGAIGVVSGAYSLWSASMATTMGTGGWLMTLLGVVVLIHGALLFTGVADRIGDASGPLMIGYSVLMLLNQALLGSGMMGGMDGAAMDQRMMDGGMVGMGSDPGMVALAVLMLVSGVIMSRDGDDTTGM